MDFTLGIVWQKPKRATIPRNLKKPKVYDVTISFICNIKFAASIVSPVENGTKVAYSKVTGELITKHLT